MIRSALRLDASRFGLAKRSGFRLAGVSTQHARLQLRSSSLAFALPSASGTRGMKVYTKTGDKGTSQLFNGERRDKDDTVFQALGSVDECNAMIGLACEYAVSDEAPLAALGGAERAAREAREAAFVLQLQNVMSRLFDVGASVATPVTKSSAAKMKRASFAGSHVLGMEADIDAMDAELPPLTTFVLPSGGRCAAHLHVARTLARRAERQVVPLVRAGDVDEQVGKYLNRLSDYLFVSARFMAMAQGFQERIWVKHVETETETE